jgi:hypothetical protein
MGALDGRVAVITGAGRGLGREHALLFAAEGAKVVVNDPGGNPDGSGTDAGPAEEVAAEIRALGHEAVANTDSVADWAGAERIVQAAVEAYGDLDIVVNNAGVLRDRSLVNMSEDEFDVVAASPTSCGSAPSTRGGTSRWPRCSTSGRRRPRPTSSRRWRTSACWPSTSTPPTTRCSASSWPTCSSTRGWRA